MQPQAGLRLFSVASACALVLLSASSSRAQIYPFLLPDLLPDCLSSSINPECYDDQNVIRASGFSHFDGSGSPTLLGGVAAAPFEALLKVQPLWQRLYSTQVSMHVIDKIKPKTLLNIVDGSAIYTDEDFNSWRQIDGQWYVRMAHQFNTNDAQEHKLWCGSIPLCTGSGGGAEVVNAGVGGGPVFFAPILAENAPQAEKVKVNLGDWLRARPTEYDLANPETVNARANFFVGGRGIDSPPGTAFWDQVSLVWVNPDQLFRPAQNPNISIASFASNIVDHFSPIQGSPDISWCINQFANVVVSEVEKNGKCKMAADQTDGNLFDNFRDYYISYFNAGSNSDSPDFYPFPFTGLGVTYDPYYQAQLEASSTEAELSAILPSLIGTSEFVYAIPKYGQSNTAKMYLDAVYPISSAVSYPAAPGPLPILGVGASFAFTRRLRQRIRLARRLN